MRQGEYNAAVDAWVRNIEKSYPAYLVVVRGVDLKRERGETEKLKVGSVIKRELMAAAGMAGVFVDGGASVSAGPGLGASRRAGARRQHGLTQSTVGFRRDRSKLLESSADPLPRADSVSPSPSVV